VLGDDSVVDLKRGDNSPEAPVHYSYSQCRTYSMCPQKWYNSKVLKQPQRPNYNMLSGSAVHVGLEVHNLLRQRGRQGRSAQEVIDSSVAELESRDDLSEIGMPAGDAVDQLVQDITGPVSHYLEHTEAAVWREGDPLLVKVEQEILWEVLGIPFVGYIDLNPDGAPIVDYKLTKRKKSAGQVESDAQLCIYSQIVGKPAAFLQLMRGRPITVYAEQMATSRTIAGVNAWAESCVAGMEQARKTGIVQRCQPGDWMCTSAQCEFYHQCYS